MELIPRTSLLLLTVSLLSLLLLAACGVSKEQARKDAMDAYDHKDFVAAVAMLSKVLRDNPKDLLAHKYLAISNERLEQFPQAKRQYQWLADNAETPLDKETAIKNYKRISADSDELKPRLVLLTADWCKYAKRFEPTFKKVGEEYKDKVDCVIIDIEKPERKEMMDSYNSLFRRMYGSTGVPCFAFECKHGVVQTAVFGELTEEEFRKGLARHLKDIAEKGDPD